MLIGFRVKNFRSFGDEAVLTFLAEAGGADDGRLIHGEAGSGYKLMAVYGPNAGGKSNFVKALAVFKQIVEQSAKETTFGDVLPVEAFQLNQTLKGQPTTFEIEFEFEGVWYNYAFSATPEKVTEERLSVFSKGREQTWFSRLEGVDGKSEWQFGRQLKGSKALWREMTRPNALFLSTAVQLNSEQLKPVARWIGERLVIVGRSSGETMRTLLAGSEEERREVLAFVKAADASIAGLEVKRVKMTTAAADQAARALRETLPVLTHEVRVVHRDDQSNPVKFPLNQESSGTQRMLWLSALFLRAKREDLTLVADEMDSTLHPVLFRRLMKLINDNTRGSQLLFTTHNTTYLSEASLLSRGQVWLVDRTEGQQMSALYPLSDFLPLSEVEHENLEAMYLDGRYGATPRREVD